MNLIKPHKIVTATILVGIIGSAVGIAVINQPVDNQVRHVPEMVVEPKERVKETPPVTTPATTPVTNPENVLEAPAPEVLDVPVVEVIEETVILSTHEYANIYLNMSDPVSLMCVEAMEIRYPDRFAPEVRERNIKALRAFSNPCAGSSKELLFNKRASHYLDYPYHGAFWDSELAINNH